MATTLTQFRAAVSANVGLNNAATPPGDQTNLDTWINAGIADLCQRVRPSITATTITLTPATYDYTLATTYLAINDLYGTDVTANNTYHLIRVSPQEILDYRVGTQFVGGPPVRYYALDGFNLLMVYPTPTSADTITVYGQARPAALASGSDSTTAIPDEWQDLIEFYASWRGGQFINDQASQNGATWLALYEAGLTEMRKAMMRRGGRRMSKAQVGNFPGGHRPIGRNDQLYC